MKWKVDWDDDVYGYDESYQEWWVVTDGTTSFKADSEDEAEWLARILNETEDSK